MPATRKKFWAEKLEKNKQRDQKTRRKLRNQGWDILVIWECQTKDLDYLTERIQTFLDNE